MRSADDTMKQKRRQSEEKTEVRELGEPKYETK